MFYFLLFVLGLIVGLMLGATFTTLGWLKTFGLDLDKVEDFEEKQKEADIINELISNSNVIGKS